MNRGLQFFMPTAGEWYEYNDKVLDRRDGVPSSATATNDDPSGVYMLTNSMPAFVLNLTRPNLNWCIDSELLSRHETKVNVGSSYFVMDRCVLGPKICCWHASVDKRASALVESFAKEVSNGLRWILQIYRTTNIMQQHDLFNSDLAIAKSIRNKLAFGNYTPVRLVAPLRDDTDCDEVPMITNGGESPFFVQPFGHSSGTTAPIGGTGQFIRPYLGTAPVTGFCSSSDLDNLAVRDPYQPTNEELKRLNDMISKNREASMNIPPSGVFFKPAASKRKADGSAAAAATVDTPVIATATNTNTHHPDVRPTTVNTEVPTPQLPPTLPLIQSPYTFGEFEENNSNEINMADTTTNDFLGAR